MNLVSCDTFVVLPPLTAHGGVIFGKNSDRPYGEVQELVYRPAQQHPAGDKLQVNKNTVISCGTSVFCLKVWLPFGLFSQHNQYPTQKDINSCISAAK